MDRREVLRLLAALPLLGVPAACRTEGAAMTTPTSHPATRPMPAIFLAHGAPILADDAGWVGELAAWAGGLPRPRAVLMVSAHWEERPLTLGATTTVPLVYDFYGFPQRYYQVRYPAPGAPALAARVRELLREGSIAVAEDARRGLDHGAYVPLAAMYPQADVPVLQVSMPGLDLRTLLDVGRALAPLRQEGVLIVGSGFLTHNMRTAFVSETPAWARDFDAWAAESLRRLDVDALLDFRTRAPAAATALPTYEHYAPLLVAVGAVAGAEVPVTFPITGFWDASGSFTRRSVQLG